MSHANRVLVIGLDCATPRFLFGPEAFDLPNLRRLMERGAWGKLRSCDPPITIPAWTVMTTGRDPGELGVYGFQRRDDRAYFSERLNTSHAITHPRVWDRLGHEGKRSIVLGVPQTYPVTPIEGVIVGGLLTPDTSGVFSEPAAVGDEIKRRFGDYLIDVPNFRSAGKEELLRGLHELLDNRFAIAEHLMESQPWDFFMMVDIGLDRLHHGFWRYCDVRHPRHVHDSRFRDAFADYYRKMDGHIGALVAAAGEDTSVLVVSDHGARAMEGGFHINQWLVDEGWLVLKSTPAKPTPLRQADIDWPRTRAWSSGGYCARINLNVCGREPEGCIAPGDHCAVRDELAEALANLRRADGEAMMNRVVVPEEVYRTVNGVAPDLLVYLGDLAWRALGGVGVEELFTAENDTGIDDANHDYDGIIIVDSHDRDTEIGDGASILDVTPTVLDLFGCDGIADLKGRSLLRP